MFDILDFIDSKDVREYNRNTHFTPIEQAVLIYRSTKATMAQKLSAWHELLDSYTTNEFQQGQVGKITDSSCCFREIVENTVKRYEQSLADRCNNDECVFIALFCEVTESDFLDYEYFSNYDAAFAYLQREKQSYNDDEYMSKIKTEARIQRSRLDTLDMAHTDTYCFDHDLRLTEIIINHGDNPDYDLMDFFVYVPMPFHKGDILKIPYDTGDEYYVLSHEVDRAYYKQCFEQGDGSDMIILADTLEKCEGQWKFNYEHPSFLLFEKCAEEELPEEWKILKTLSEVYRGETSLTSLLFEYSHPELER